jgi:hypothetical protein
MNATDKKVRFELGIPGDVAHRASEAVTALVALGFRLEGRLDSGAVYILADHEDAVDSSTVDAPAAPGPKPYQMCGQPVCTHRFDAHDENGCTVVLAGGPRVCRCPGFTVITGGMAQRYSPGPY